MAKRKRDTTNQNNNNNNKKKQKTNAGTSRTTGIYGRYTPNAKKVVAEKKWKDFSHNGTIEKLAGGGPYGESIFIPSLVDISVGSGPNQRIGRTIQLKSVHVNGYASINATADYDYVRIIVYMDRQCNGAEATPEQILAPDSTGSPGPMSFLNLENSKRFYILKDWRWSDEPKLAYNGTTVVGSEVVKDYQFNISLDEPIEYGSGGTGIANIKSNNIGILAVCYRKTQTTTSSLRMTCRVRYTDS